MLTDAMPSTDHAARAIAAVERRAARDRGAAMERWDARRGDVDGWFGQLVRAGRLTLNFHPDRLDRSGRRVSAGLLADGRYRSQWVTGISNGGRSAFRGGDRARWEDELFDSAYADADAAVDEFPLYGALDVFRDEHGGSPRFGSSFVVLRDAVLERTTLTVGDSHMAPVDVGTVRAPWSVAAALAEQAAAGVLLGRAVDDALAQRLLAGEHVQRGPSRDLDHYVEAQVHGGVELAADVEAMVLDPSFRGTPVESDLAEVARRHRIDLVWHSGSELAADDVTADFRGPDIPPLARRVAHEDGVVDAHAIGIAAASMVLPPMAPGGDPPDSAPQRLKRLWHCVLAFGSAATR